MITCTALGMSGRVRRPNGRQIGLIYTQPSSEITNGAAAPIRRVFALRFNFGWPSQ